MAKRSFRGVTRSRRLTRSEAAKYRKIREQVIQEFPPAKVSPEKVAIARLRAMREAKGISLSELAARTGMTRGNLARLEFQENATLQRYADGLDCQLEINVVSANVTKRPRRGAAG
jgi:DNA-binding Xre family transcriptional regulator